MAENPQYRDATPEDAEEIASCFRAAYGETSPHPFLDPYHLQSFLADDSHLTLVAEHDSSIIATGSVITEADGYRAQMGRMVVDPRHHDQHIGSRLHDALYERIPPTVERVYAEAVASHPHAQQILETRGFTCAALYRQIHPALSGHDGRETEILMVTTSPQNESAPEHETIRDGLSRYQHPKTEIPYAAALNEIETPFDGTLRYQLAAAEGDHAIPKTLNERLEDPSTEHILIESCLPPQATSHRMLRDHGFTLAGYVPRWYGPEDHYPPTASFWQYSEHAAHDIWATDAVHNLIDDLELPYEPLQNTPDGFHQLRL